MIKKFLEEHHHLKLATQHLGIHGGGFMVQVYNTTWDYTCSEPIFEHFVTDFDLANLNVNFETAIITPVISWWDVVNKKQKGE